MNTLAATPELVVGFVPTDVTGVIAWIVTAMIVVSVLFFLYVSFALEDAERADTESKRDDTESIDPE